MLFEINKSITSALFLGRDGKRLFSAHLSTVPSEGQLITHKGTDYQVKQVKWQTAAISEDLPHHRDLLATVQLQAIADGCLNKIEGE